MAVDRRLSPATVGVVGLAVLALGLSYFALTGTGSSDAEAAARVAPRTPSAAASPSAVARPSVAATTTVPIPTASVPSTAAPVVVAGQALVVVSADEAWRATGGSCRTAGDVSAVETTQDGGVTWTRVTSPLARVVSLTTTTGGITAGGFDSTCTLRFRTTTDGGTTWPLDGGSGGAWTHSAKTVLAPSGEVSSPCAQSEVVDVDGAGAKTVYVLCADGTVRLSVDEGATYLKIAARPGAAALARTSDGTIYLAQRAVVGCAGLAVAASGDEGTTWTTTGCAPAATGRGAVGFAVDGAVAMLTDGTRTFRSTDTGSSWS